MVGLLLNVLKMLLLVLWNQRWSMSNSLVVSFYIDIMFLPGVYLNSRLVWVWKCHLICWARSIIRWLSLIHHIAFWNVEHKCKTGFYLPLFYPWKASSRLLNLHVHLLCMCNNIQTYRVGCTSNCLMCRTVCMFCITCIVTDLIPVTSWTSFLQTRIFWYQ